jgi:malonyl-CoA O-methyltransferase
VAETQARADIPDLAATEALPTRAGYDRWAEVYDVEDNPLVALEEQHIAPFLDGASGLAVADVGCGTGRHALRLAAAGARVTAVDFSEAMLRLARAKPGGGAVTFLCHDLARPLPLASAAFDRVLCCLVTEHIADLAGLFGELRRLCRPDGFVVVSAMHPALLLRGVQARFIDPATGRRVSPFSYPHQMADYVMAAVRAGLALDHLSEHPVDDALAARSARGRKYLGWPMLLLMRLAPGGGRWTGKSEERPLDPGGAEERAAL